MRNNDPYISDWYLRGTLGIIQSKIIWFCGYILLPLLCSMSLISPNFDVNSVIFSQFWLGAFSQNCWKKPCKYQSQKQTQQVNSENLHPPTLNVCLLYLEGFVFQNILILQLHCSILWFDCGWCSFYYTRFFVRKIGYINFVPKLVRCPSVRASVCLSVRPSCFL